MRQHIKRNAGTHRVFGTGQIVDIECVLRVSIDFLVSISRPCIPREKKKFLSMGQHIHTQTYTRTHRSTHSYTHKTIICIKYILHIYTYVFTRIQVHRRRRAEHAAAASRATHYAAHFRGYHLIIVWCLRCEFRAIEYYIYFYLHYTTLYLSVYVIIRRFIVIIVIIINLEFGFTIIFSTAIGIYIRAILHGILMTKGCSLQYHRNTLLHSCSAFTEYIN